MVPCWPNQICFLVLFKMLIETPILITSRKHFLELPQYPDLLQFFWSKINMVVCHLADHSRKQKSFTKSSKNIGSIVVTINGYAGHVQRFTQYCHQQYFDPFQATTKVCIEYSTENFHTGVSYLSVNTARSVLSTIFKTENKIPFWELSLVSRFLKRVFNSKVQLFQDIPLHGMNLFSLSM